ncbi:MAG: penicillin-binding protein 1A, partial [candidate division WOR-3 bacterium]|nr:penicillin-binding protein 1A [candidate division WOR-3 bacterium]
MNIKTKRRKTALILAIIAFIFGFAFSAIFRLGAGLPSPEQIKNYRPPVSTKIYDCKQQLVYEFFQQKRTPVALNEIPQMLKDALIVVEDKRFYSHWGVDVIRVFGALFYNLKSMRKAQGASTITQQLARNMFLTQEKTLVRKLKELLLALELERTYSKDEILEMYLNQVWFGSGAYGVEAAAQVYFNKSVKDLTLPECALLAALPKAPQYYSPYVNPAQALKRRNLFLKMLYKAKKISKADLDKALASPLGVVPKKSLKNPAPYFVEEIRKYLIDKYGEDFVYRSGVKIYTTLDLDMQLVANQVIEKHLAQIERDYRLSFTKSKYDSIARFDSLISPNYLQGALVAIDPKTGYIKAMVGGRDFSESQFNRTIQAKRQAGSAFKPFVYAVAVDQGFTPADLETDEEIVLNIPGVKESYRPRNFDNKFMGLMTLRRALALSRNIVAVRLISKVSPENVVRYASAMGISSRLQPVYSLALGACEVSLLDLTRAFAVFANDGYKIKPMLILKIVDADGTIIEDNSIETEPVLDAKVAYIITNMLESVVNEGTAYVIRKMGFNYPAAGKTGTTDDYTDCWFIGYTPELVCGIWVGYDAKKTIFRGATGGGVSAPIWADFMNGIVQLL